MHRHLMVLFAAFLLSSGGLPPAAQEQEPVIGRVMGTEIGFGLFQTHCTACHGNPNGPETAPDPDVIRQMPPERILAALTTGAMQVHVQDFTEQQIRAMAEFMSGRPLGSAQLGDAAQMPNRCTDNPPLADPAAGPRWNGWGVDAANSRYQDAANAGLDAAEVPRLTLRWAFGFPNGVSAYAQPAVASGRVYTGSDIGFVYALDAASGCVYWSYETGTQVRTGISIGVITIDGAARQAVFFGDLKANVYALDAHGGGLLWTTRVDDHFTARITATPTLHEGRLYVPVSSSEGFSGGTPDYPCCTFRGSVTALDATTGRQLWQTYTVGADNIPSKQNERGIQLYAPAGVSVWNSPTVDESARAIYFGTGDAWTEPAAPTSDSVMALDMDTGAVRWVYQGTANDVWLGGCFGAEKSAACPAQQGPDNDFGGSPILRVLPGGGRVLVAAQKMTNVYALDPDHGGSLVWRAQAAPDPRGGVFWGGAADQMRVYFTLSDGGLTAFDLATGRRDWYQPLGTKESQVSTTAVPTQIPDVIFTGSADGILRAHAANDGAILWQYDTAREFHTVNGVAARGGTMRSAGPVVAGGMLFVGSGYGVIGGGDKPGNVLLAFAPD